MISLVGGRVDGRMVGWVVSWVDSWLVGWCSSGWLFSNFLLSLLE